MRSRQTSTPPHSDVAARVASRRRVGLRVGFALLLLCTASACIFEKSDYQGGGRLAQGATAQDSTTAPEPTQTTTTTTTSTTTSQPDTGAPDTGGALDGG